MSLKLKTILGVAVIEAVLLALLISLTVNYLKSTNYEGLQKRASTTATLFATTTKDAVLSYDLASLEAFASELMKNPDLIYVRVISPDGDVFAQAGDKRLLTRPFSEDSDVALVFDGVFDVKAEISEGGELYGIVHIGLDTSGLVKTINEAWQWSAFIALGEMGLVALFSFLLGSYLTGQLSKLQQAANVISAGKMGVVVKVSGRDEIADVADAFNQMSQRLKQASERRDQYEKELEELNRSLENRVAVRTEQLSQNIKKLQSINEQLQQTQARLVQSEKMASIGTLAAGVAHEINNPVGFVMSNVKTLSEYIETYNGAIERITLIQKETDRDEQQCLLGALHAWLQGQDMDFLQEDVSELLSDTLDGTARIKDIVAGLKEFSHVDQSTDFKPADLNEAIEQTLKIANNELKYNANVVTRLDDISTVNCNVGQIRQVLLNLIINAGHAVGEQGNILIKSGQTDKHIFISVTDNGCGIDPALQKKIFDPFFTTKDIGKGTGLGLSIAYGIMEEHGGVIRVQSTPGKGTRFTLLFPAQETVIG